MTWLYCGSVNNKIDNSSTGITNFANMSLLVKIIQLKKIVLSGEPVENKEMYCKYNKFGVRQSLF